MEAKQRHSKPRAHPHTEQAFEHIMAHCRHIFMDKMHDYGTAWRILHHSSLTDQLLIKILRMRNLQHTPQQISDSIEEDAIGVINYSIMALIQYQLGMPQDLDAAANNTEHIAEHYDATVDKIKTLLQRKNNDYGEAWRHMRLLSLCDMLLVKVLRLRQIEDNDGIVKNSESPTEIYADIVNYTLFLLIMRNFSPHASS